MLVWFVGLRCGGVGLLVGWFALFGFLFGVGGFCCGGLLLTCCFGFGFGLLDFFWFLLFCFVSCFWICWHVCFAFTLVWLCTVWSFGWFSVGAGFLFGLVDFSRFCAINLSCDLVS